MTVFKTRILIVLVCLIAATGSACSKNRSKPVIHADTATYVTTVLSTGSKKTKHSLEQTQIQSLPVSSSPTPSPNKSFEGYRKRTGVIRACSAELAIVKSSDKSFDFTLTAFYGDHFGELSGTAQITAAGLAVFTIKAADEHDTFVLRFAMDTDGGDGIRLCHEGDLQALDFGMNVLPDGYYVIGEPKYTSDDYPMLVFGSDRIQKRVKQLMVATNEVGDETAYHNLIDVMQQGIPETVENGRYKGFLPGQTRGADLLISAESHIYLLAYGLDDRKIVFYTTDINCLSGEYPEEFQMSEDVFRDEAIMAYDGFPGIYEDY